MQNNILKALVLAVILCVWTVSFSSNYAQDVSEAEYLLQKAIVSEDIDGDLQAAIEQYRKIVAGNGANRSIAAKALLRLAGCYEKLGQKQAQKTYEQLIQDYPDQVEAVKVAQTKLTLLERGKTSVTLRRVWAGPEVELMGALSPDGRYISYTDWDTGGLAIHDLTTGENRRIDNRKKWDRSYNENSKWPPDSNRSYAENSRWSPDGSLIAYTWATQGNTAELRVTGLDGAKSRILLSDPQYPWLTVEDWTPDGRQILVKLYEEDSMRNPGFISLITSSNGSVRHLKKTDRLAVGSMKYSPDGRYIAFDLQNQSVSGGTPFPADKDIYLLSADGKTQTPIVRNPADDYLLGWSPNGDNILFASDRSGTIDAWILPVTNGKPAGQARMVQKNIGAISPLGITRDGAFFCGSGKDLWNIYTGMIHKKSQTLTAKYKKLELPFEGRNDYAELSPDGKRLAFVRTSSRKGKRPSSEWDDSLCILDLETGEEKTFPLNLQTRLLHWSPDGSSILTRGSSREYETFVSTIDVRSGEKKEIFSIEMNKNEDTYYCSNWSTDGSSIYCVRTVHPLTGDRHSMIVVKNLETGQIRVISKDMKNRGTSPGSVSPDGKWLVGFEGPMLSSSGDIENILKIISVKDGETRELCSFVDADFSAAPYPRWSRDGRFIFFPGRRTGQEKWDVWYAPVAGGELKQMGLLLHEIEDISLHPDGVRFIFSSYGPAIHGPEVWVMENFLPK